MLQKQPPAKVARARLFDDAARAVCGGPVRRPRATRARMPSVRRRTLMLAPELLPALDAGAFANDDELVRLDARDLLRGAARPADHELRRRRGAQPEVQAAV